MNAIPFCVIERRYTIWGHDLEADNSRFLESVDSGLYYRTAHNLLAAPAEEAGSEAEIGEVLDSDQRRKDVSSLSRLLWHHGIETLLMMLGAYVQAPMAAQAYFLKCKNEDSVSVARFLLEERRPKYHCLDDTEFTLVRLLNGIHRCAGWADREPIINNFTRALRSMLRDYADEKHRLEYNSIKHGLRAAHGQFGLSFGLEETPGVQAPPEAMQLIGFSRDASHFEVARPLGNAGKQASKTHFMTEQISVSWSLEKVVCDLQLISFLIKNTVSALRIANGATPGTTTFEKIADDEAFWIVYHGLRSSDVPYLSMALEVDARNVNLLSDKQIFDYYQRRRTLSGESR